MDRGTLRHGNITRALIQGLSAWGQLILVVVAWLHGWAESGDPRCGGGVRDETKRRFVQTKVVSASGPSFSRVKGRLLWTRHINIT